MFVLKNTAKTFCLQNIHLIGFEATSCVYQVLPFEQQKALIFLAIFLSQADVLPPQQLLSNFDPKVNIFSQGVYTKYVEGGTGGFYKFFKKAFVAQETIYLNISWPSNFFGKYFMAPPINFSFLFKAFFQQYFRVHVL